MEQKVCRECNIEKSTSEYHKDRSCKYGVSSVCKECRNDYYKKQREDNKDEFHKARREYLDNNKENTRKLVKKWAKNNRDKINKYRKYRRDKDPEFKLLENTRSRIHGAVKQANAIKSNKTIELLGCSIQEYRFYLESKFEEGMTWDNHSLDGWHIDHIIPLYHFDFTREDEQRRAFNYMNTQPLWAKDNLSKNKNMPNSGSEGKK